ncbi:unnamed protein product [Clavelina lepadiformis]|uniref:Uncharacterized protein n=1 Tax=Clavelina lepadiformis TaxID=159417 RepID=A0ABP0GKN8_CLALP
MGEFQHGLFGCFDNCGVCIVSYFVPCYTVGKTAEAVGDSCCVCCLAYFFTGCIAGSIIRGRVRQQKGIEGSSLGDFCIHFFCPFCAVIQDHNEVIGSVGAAGESIARVLFVLAYSIKEPKFVQNPTLLHRRINDGLIGVVSLLHRTRLIL